MSAKKRNTVDGYVQNREIQLTDSKKYRQLGPIIILAILAREVTI